MRPLTRRWGPNDLESARRVVSTAEREALDQAEQLRKEAEALLEASEQQRAAEEQKAREEVTSEVDGLRAELAQATTRATEAETELQRLRSEWGQNGKPDPAGESAGSDPADDSARPALTLVKDEVSPNDPSYLSDFVARMTAEAEHLIEAAKAAVNQTAPDPARAETDQLLRAALAAIERDTAAAAKLVADAEEERRAAGELHRQAEREHRAAIVVREEAQNQLREVRAEVERILADATARDAQMTSARQELATEMVALRNALDVVRDALNRFIADGHPGREAIDLRELTDLGQRQRRT